MKKILLPLFFLVIFFSSCYYDKEDILYGPSQCDTSAVKYSVQVTSILNASCLSCHSGTAAAGGGIKLDSYNAVKAAADNGSLLSSVTRSVNPMPKGAARLNECRIAELRTWVRNGAPNN
ncbi:MAG: c-type cytochrome [Bacteroidota bacterium]|jgi:mono/diheme cytochrome c family protein